MIASGTAIVTVLFLHVNSVSVESSLPLLATRAVWEREAGGGRREGDGATRRKLYLASPMKDWQPCMAGVGGIESRGRGLTVLELGRNGEDEGNCRVERGESQVELCGGWKWRRDSSSREAGTERRRFAARASRQP